MKRLSIRTLIAAIAIGFAVQAAQAQVAVSVSIGGFYDELAPYGRWHDCSYGQCWVPARVAADWQPYSNGQWIYTEYGWTWVSDDPWGGNPYHYGTWTSIAGLGWAWVPGTVWAPAWVTWSYSNSYVGWAPIPPNIAFGASGYAGAPVVVNQTQYVFVTTNNFVGRNVSSVRIPPQQSAQIFRETRPVTGFAVSGGIVRNTALPMATIERASKGKIETRSIQTARTAPRAVSAGTGHLAVVAPASEIKAVAAQPRGGNRSEASRAPKDAQPPADRAPASAKAHGAPPAQKQRSAPPAHEAKAPPPARPQTASKPPESSRGEKSAKPPADREPADAKPPKAHEGPPMESHRPAAEAPTVKHQEPPHQAEANAPAQHEKPKPPPSKSKPKPKPSEQDKKPDGEKP